MRKENRILRFKKEGIDTSKFFDVNEMKIQINGVPYVLRMEDAEAIEKIVEDGYVFNSKTDGRFVTAQTFRMLNGKTYNRKTRQWEKGWDAYLRNNYSYMYQFEMMLDEVHRLARMERDNDPEFARLSKFFTRDVVLNTCSQYIRRLRKYVKGLEVKYCKGTPYVTLKGYGNVFLSDLNGTVYTGLENIRDKVESCYTYDGLEFWLKRFVNNMVELPKDTPKEEQWKTAFKGKGAYLTLLNIIKFHGVTVRNYETWQLLNREASISYVEGLLDTYHPNEYWKFHELLKKTIELNHFDLQKSIETQRK